MEKKSNLEARIRHLTGKAISDFGLIENGDVILAAVSGGKDSLTMLYILSILKKRAPVNFNIIAVNIHHEHPDYDVSLLKDFSEGLNIPFYIEKYPINEMLKDKFEGSRKNPCFLCARVRRGILYKVSQRLGCNKIALAHHREDFIETLLLNIFYSSKIMSMAVKLRSNDEKNEVIRPFVYVAEADIEKLSNDLGFPVIKDHCPLQLENKKFNFKRKKMKDLLNELEREIPHIKHSMLKSLSNIRKSHLLDI